jgi:DNA integrity scanning protein DisA with diadenylate cyclase activity
MWPYQRPFQIIVGSLIEGLFKTLDPHFASKVFLVAVLKRDIPNYHKICLEPEECGYSQADFNTLFNLVENSNSAISKFNKKEELPKDQKRSLYYELLRQLKKELLAIIKEDDLDSGYQSYVSFPVEKENYYVHIVLQVNRTTMDKYYSLRHNHYQQFTISTSLIDSLAREAIESVQREISLPDAGESFHFSHSEEEILRKAGKDLFYSVVAKGENFEGLHIAYDAINAVSSMKYEGEETRGGLVISPIGHENVCVNIRFVKPVNIREYRKVAKLLRLTSKGTFLLSDSFRIYGIGSIIGNYNSQSENLFVVEFIQHHSWRVLHNNSCLMVVKYGRPELPKSAISKEEFSKTYESLFKNTSPISRDKVFNLIQECFGQRHGTILAISSGAKTEVERLSNQGFQIEPFPINVGEISLFSNIDGAVMISPDGICHGLGIILDGKATASGDSSRGARYNSAVRYYESVKDVFPTMLVVVSEDGMVNVIGELDGNAVSGKIEK